MCTIIVSRDFKYYPFVVASQRDELLDRPAAPPAVWDGEPPMFAPRDLKRGGTWQGVNAFGVYCGVTNRNDVKSYCMELHGIEMEGRGDIVPMALEARTAREAFERVWKLDATRYNGFHFVAADATETYVIRGNGKDGDPAMDGRRVDEAFCLVTNGGIGRGHSARARKVEREYDRLLKRGSPPTYGALAPLLNIHDDPNYTFEADRLCGSCIHRPHLNYGSRSSAVIRPQDRDGRRFWEYWHRERPAPDKHVCDGRWVKQPDFAIIAP